jgi:hypothetical protein
MYNPTTQLQFDSLNKGSQQFVKRIEAATIFVFDGITVDMKSRIIDGEIIKKRIATLHFDNNRQFSCDFDRMVEQFSKHDMSVLNDINENQYYIDYQDTVGHIYLQIDGELLKDGEYGTPNLIGIEGK